MPGLVDFRHGTSYRLRRRLVEGHKEDNGRIVTVVQPADLVCGVGRPAAVEFAGPAYPREVLTSSFITT